MPPRLQSQPNFEDGSVYRQLRPTRLYCTANSPVEGDLCGVRSPYGRVLRRGYGVDDGGLAGLDLFAVPASATGWRRGRGRRGRRPSLTLRSSTPTHHTTGIDRPRCADRLPSDISKMAVSTVSGGGLPFTEDTTEPFSGISWTFFPGIKLSSGMGTE